VLVGCRVRPLLRRLLHSAVAAAPAAADRCGLQKVARSEQLEYVRPSVVVEGCCCCRLPLLLQIEDFVALLLVTCRMRDCSVVIKARCV
jgi:hypothetical protein